MAVETRNRKKQRHAIIKTSSDDEYTDNLAHKSKTLVQNNKAEKNCKNDWSFDFSKPLTVAKRSKTTITQPTPPPATAILPNDFYCPTIDFDSLIIHKKKLEELSAWFESFHARINKKEGSILLLSGPTGSGKSASAMAACKKYNLRALDGYENFQKFKQERPSRSLYPALNLINSSSGSSDNDEDDTSNGDADNKFKRATYSTEQNSSLLLLIDDLPNLEAKSVLEQCIEIADKGIQVILIVTDPCGHQSPFSDPDLRKISQNSLTCHVQFKPIALSLMKKLLPKTTKTSNEGDARAAIIDSHIEEVLSRDKPVRDASIGFMHALGKILYGSSKDIDPSHLTETDETKFHSFLFENYPYYQTNLESIVRISDAFSFIDSVEWNVRLDERWPTSFGTLPEMEIFHAATENPPKGFKPIIAPRYIPSSKIKGAFATR